MRRYVGNVLIRGARGVNLPLPTAMISPSQVRLGNDAHTMLLTRRQVIASSGEADDSLGVCQVAQRGALVHRSKTIVQVQPTDVDPLLTTTIYTATHETAHSFGLGHCDCEDCIMAPKTTKARAMQLNQKLLYGEPFCDDCAEDLEIGSLTSLADDIPQQ